MDSASLLKGKKSDLIFGKPETGLHWFSPIYQGLNAALNAACERGGDDRTHPWRQALVLVQQTEVPLVPKLAIEVSPPFGSQNCCG